MNQRFSGCNPDEGLTKTRIRVRVRPGARRDALVAVKMSQTGYIALSLEVRAAATGGQANEAVISLLSRLLADDMPTITLITGARSRSKTFTVTEPASKIMAALARKYTQAQRGAT